MAISINYLTNVIYVPQSFLTPLGGLRYQLDVNAFRNALKDLEDDPEGMVIPDTHRHSTESILSGVTYARQVEILSPYTVEFENGMYQVECIGANHNILDRKVVNSVSLVIGNSAGLISVNTGGGGGSSAADVWAYPSRTLTSSTVGMFSTPLAFKADSNTSAADPGTGDLRWNNSTQNEATSLYLNSVTDSGLDLSNYINTISAGSTLFVQEKDDAAKYQKWQIGTITNNIGWMTIPVSLLASSGGNIANNQQIVLVFNNLNVVNVAPTAEENANAVATHPETLTVHKYIGLAP
jgi:hypothetical protein